ncbi:NADH dehydrogenase [ubiquinone] 1 subunit C1, mitochondrial isoform X1 [Cervus elaphus]|uniref:NADH dehydrogenase [ubiquinone] 1 subunit C1, mitochondrial isoform X1 n=1 Tax=Cervus canadensis TaxID=1574408 RepID=UPI001C9E6003|nr:NADH dehydrogenase [ubiquinone] 1 subunit C1, mitochondrial isoform X1 [Cervus canadensis]XP_043758385.1 NADH dehydrogenase [ubiquinone] 1 subunit C1, mitochondrial isoform X1 [Cervus elaphus]
MAPSALMRPFWKLLAPARFPIVSSSRSKFYIREPPHGSPNWPKVGLTLGTSVFLWIYEDPLSTEPSGKPFVKWILSPI